MKISAYIVNGGQTKDIVYTCTFADEKKQRFCVILICTSLHCMKCTVNLAPANLSTRLSAGCDHLITRLSKPGDNLVDRFTGAGLSEVDSSLKQV